MTKIFWITLQKVGNMTFGYRPCFIIYETKSYYYYVAGTTSTYRVCEGEYVIKPDNIIPKETKILFNQIRWVLKTEVTDNRILLDYSINIRDLMIKKCLENYQNRKDKKICVDKNNRKYLVLIPNKRNCLVIPIKKIEYDCVELENYFKVLEDRDSLKIIDTNVKTFSNIKISDIVEKILTCNSNIKITI